MGPKTIRAPPSLLRLVSEQPRTGNGEAISTDQLSPVTNIHATVPKHPHSSTLCGFLWTTVEKGGRNELQTRELAVELTVLMGHAPAKIDEKGRLKIPTNFRKIIEDRFGQECFITSTDGERALVYPLPVWYDFQSRLAKVPSTSMARTRLLERVNYFGQISTLDAQGRVLVPAVLRDVAGITDDVVVIGNQDHLIVWNEERIQRRMTEQPLTVEDFKELELHGV
jgi:MraZ protein